MEFKPFMMPAVTICSSALHLMGTRVGREIQEFVRLVFLVAIGMGSAVSQPFGATWYGRTMAAWRQEMWERTPEVCMGCPFYEERAV